MVDDVQHLGSADSANEHPEHEIRDVFSIQADAQAAPAGCPHPNHEAGGQHNAVPMDRYAAEIKRYRIHVRTVGAGQIGGKSGLFGF